MGTLNSKDIFLNTFISITSYKEGQAMTKKDEQLQNQYELQINMKITKTV